MGARTGPVHGLPLNRPIAFPLESALLRMIRVLLVQSITVSLCPRASTPGRLKEFPVSIDRPGAANEGESEQGEEGELHWSGHQQIRRGPSMFSAYVHPATYAIVTATLHPGCKSRYLLLINAADDGKGA